MNTYNSRILGQAIDQFMNQNLADVFGVQVVTNQPSVNIQDLSESHLLEIAIPGIPKDQIELRIEQDQLIVSAKKQSIKEQEPQDEPLENNKASGNTVKYEKREFNYQSFERSFKLPETADKDRVTASYEAGILKIEIAKKEEAVDRGPISIEIG